MAKKEFRTTNPGTFVCIDCSQHFCRFCEWSGSPRICKECRCGLCVECYVASHEHREGYCILCFNQEKRAQVTPPEAWRSEWKPRKDRSRWKAMLTAEMERRAKKKEDRDAGSKG